MLTELKERPQASWHCFKTGRWSSGPAELDPVVVWPLARSVHEDCARGSCRVASGLDSMRHTTAIVCTQGLWKRYLLYPKQPR